MKKKILFIIMLLLINVNASALICEYEGSSNEKTIHYRLSADNDDSSVKDSNFTLDGDRIGSGSISTFFGEIVNEKNEITSCPSIIYFKVLNSRYYYLTVRMAYSSDISCLAVGTLTLTSSSDLPSSGGSGDGSGDTGSGSGSSDKDLSGGFTFSGGNCNGVKDIQNLMTKYINTPLKTLAVVLLVVLTIVDFVKNIGDKDADPKKPFNNLIKRAVACAIIFFASDIIDILLDLTGMTSNCGNITTGSNTTTYLFDLTKSVL